MRGISGRKLFSVKFLRPPLLRKVATYSPSGEFIFEIRNDNTHVSLFNFHPTSNGVLSILNKINENLV